MSIKVFEGAFTDLNQLFIEDETSELGDDKNLIFADVEGIHEC